MVLKGMYIRFYGSFSMAHGLLGLGKNWIVFRIHCPFLCPHLHSYISHITFGISKKCSFQFHHKLSFTNFDDHKVPFHWAPVLGFPHAVCRSSMSGHLCIGSFGWLWLVAFQLFLVWHCIGFSLVFPCILVLFLCLFYRFHSTVWLLFCFVVLLLFPPGIFHCSCGPGVSSSYL